VKSTLSLFFFLVLTLLVRCHNFNDVFVGGQVYFIDADCYSRMTRVRMVVEHPFTIIRHQDFENYPQGVTSHATAPFDYLIAALAVLLEPFTADYLDLAGAIVSPLLAGMMLVFLWMWSERLQLPYRGMLLLLFAVSPILVHGTILGRPDHQSLEMLCMAVAFGAEWCFAQKPSRGWGVASGAAWGLALWTSLYEPLVLLGAVLILYLIFDRRKLWARERRDGGIVFAGIIVLALLIQGWPVSVPDVTFLRYFPKWEQTVGELASVSPFSSLLYRWVGLTLIASPVLLFMRCRETKRVIPMLLLLLLVWGLTLWEIRWGYFFALIFAMSLPFQFVVFRKPWIAWTVFAIGFWTILQEWDARLFPGDERKAQLFEQKLDAALLRDAADHLKSAETLPVLAPWWFSPALAYWSRQPAVGGSSHESLQGIVDSARFYLATDPDAALKILRAHGVKRVIAYDPQRIFQTSTVLIDQPASESSMAAILYESPHSAPDFLKFVYSHPRRSAFKIFTVED